MRSSAVGRDRAIDRAFALRQLPTSMLVMGYRRECLQAAPDRALSGLLNWTECGSWTNALGDQPNLRFGSEADQFG
jgi:hypothetical protein